MRCGDREVLIGFRKIDAKFVCVEQVASESAIKCFSSDLKRGIGSEEGWSQPRNYHRNLKTHPQVPPQGWDQTGITDRIQIGHQNGLSNEVQAG